MSSFRFFIHLRISVGIFDIQDTRAFPLMILISIFSLISCINAQPIYDYHLHQGQDGDTGNFETNLSSLLDSVSSKASLHNSTMTPLTKSTVSTNAEAMSTLSPAALVWKLQLKKSKSDASLIKKRSYGSMLAWYVTLIKTSLEFQRHIQGTWCGIIGTVLNPLQGVMLGL